jgi:hypothetical protein
MTKKVFLNKIATNHNLVQLTGWLRSLPVSDHRNLLLERIKTDLTIKPEDLNFLTFGCDRDDSNTKPQPQSQPIDKSIKIKPTSFKRGDVLLHKAFSHPYVLLENKDNMWFCGLLTTEIKCAEILEQCNSRMFSDSYFTNVLFTMQEPDGKFLSVFDNSSQVRSVLKKLKNIFK